MKLGNRVFYHLESARQGYLSSFESLPYLGGFFGAIFFVGFAIRTPIASKLYKETFLSMVLGMGTAAQYTLYKRRQYLVEVDRVYAALKEKFD